LSRFCHAVQVNSREEIGGRAEHRILPRTSDRRRVMVKFLSAAVLLLGIGWCGVASAAPVPIVNPSFELPDMDLVGCNTLPDTATCTTFGVGVGSAVGWTTSGSGGGVWDINNFSAGFWTVGAPDGDQIGWLAPAPPNPSAPAGFSQVLSAVLQANTVYTLTGFAGHPTGFPTTYSAELYAGGNLLASVSDTGPQGNFESFSLPFNSSSSPFVGQPLEIRLTTGGPQTGFDSIALDAVTNQIEPVPEPGPVQPIPEPGTWLLLSTGVGVFIRNYWKACKISGWSQLRQPECR